MGSRDEGESLIEILLSVMILGVAVSALLFGIGTAVTTAGFHDRQAQQAETARNLVELVQDHTYAPCASSYPTSTSLLPAGYSATAQVVGWASGAGFAGACPGSGDQGAQQVRLSISSGDTRVRTDELVIVKRKPCASLPC